MREVAVIIISLSQPYASLWHRWLLLLRSSKSCFQNTDDFHSEHYGRYVWFQLGKNASM